MRSKLLLVILTVSLLTACGQTGKLYLPQDENNTVMPAKAGIQEH